MLRKMRKCRVFLSEASPLRMVSWSLWRAGFAGKKTKAGLL